MKLNAQVGDHSFSLSVGNGHNDWVWLSHYAARQYSKVAYPQGVYLPTQLSIQDQEHSDYYPNPRQKIKYFLEENKLSPQTITIHVKIRKGNHSFTQFEKIWEKQAFGIERYMMNIIYVLDMNIEPNKENQKEFYFKIHLNYTMHNDVKHIFDEKKYSHVIQLELQEKAMGIKSCTFKGSIRLPFGTVTQELYSYRRDPKDRQVYRKAKEDVSKVNMNISPKFVSIEENNNLIAQEMKISDNITKAIQQKELQAKKRNANSSLCCYTFDQLWKILEEQYPNQLCLSDYQNSTIQRIKVALQKSLNSLYEIFFYYFIIENQQKQKKEQLGVTYQHVMHFLHYYRVFADMEGLQGFLQFYNSDFKFKNIKQSVDIQNKSVRFPQFIVILLRAIQFLQTTVYSVKGQTFDVSVIKIIDRIQEIDSEEEDFGQFKRNLRQNPKIISFFRNNSQSLKKIFVNQAIRSIQNSAENYVIMKEQVKEMLQLSGLTNKNTNAIVQDLFEELNFSEEGIFYYEFIEAIQWLSLAIVSSDKDSIGLIENQEEQAMLIIEKIKFFMEKIQL